MTSRERRIEGSFSFHSKMSVLTACCDESITEERNGDSRGWLARTVGKGKHATPGDGSTECLACGKRGHTVDTCFRIHKCQICGKHGHLTSTCYQNLEYMSQHIFPQNRSLSSIGSSLKCQICSKKGHTAAKCFYRADVPADHPSLFIPTCQICGLKGHTAAKCFYRADVKLDHPSLFIPTCQICGLKCHVALNCPHRTTFAYQVSESPTSLTALTALSAGSYNGNHTQSQRGYTCFPGGFHPNNGASTTSVNSEVWVSDSQRIPIPGASVHLNQLPTELMRDHNSDVVVSTCSNDSAGTGGNGNDDNNVGSHNGEGHNDYDSGSNSAGSENASNHGCNSDFVDSSHVVTCEEDNIHVLNSTIQDAYVGSIDLHDSKVGEQADDNNADINGGQNSLAFNNDKTFQKALNSSFAFFIILISRSPEFSSLFVDDKLQKGLRGVSEEDVEVVLDKQHLAKQLLSGKTVSDDAERSLLLKLKTVCGYQFTSKLTGAALSSDMTGDVNADSSMEGFSSNDLTVLQFGGNINGVSKTECYEIDGLSSGDCELVNADTNLVDNDGLIINDSSRSDDTMQGSADIDGESGDSTSADLSNDMTGDAYTMKKLKKLKMLQRGRQVEHVKAERNLYTWERAHMGIFTELRVLYARYSLEKLMDNSKLVSAFDIITEEVKDMAEAIAEEWKPKLNIFDMVASYGNSLEAHVFLQLLAAWDYSTWIRSYALFLEERLECCRVLKCDVEMDRPRTKDLNTTDLLEHLPALQQFLFRVLDCQPLGASVHNFVIQLALSMVALESIKIYQAISDGTVNLVDKFFEMQRNDALKALDIYRRAGQQAERLSEFYEVCKNLDIGRGEKFIKIEQPPASFLQAMEEYVREAPRVSIVRKDQAIDNKISAPKEILAIEDKKTQEAEAPQPSPPPPPPPEPVKVVAPVVEPPDLLGLNDPAPDTSALDEKNAMALAIVPVSDQPTTAPTQANGTGWELALVTAPSSNESATAASKLAGGLDLLTLDSLYDDAIRRNNQNVSYNPWEQAPMTGGMMLQPVHDPFFASNTVAAPPSVQMAAMANQQQQAFMYQQQQQMMMMGPQQPQSLNPFGNPHGAPAHPYGTGMPVQAYNPYTGLL